MSQKKNTARKTTGKHRLLSTSSKTTASDWIPVIHVDEMPKSRLRPRTAGVKPTPLKSILKRPSAAASSSGMHVAINMIADRRMGSNTHSVADSTSLPRITSLSSSDSLDDPLLPARVPKSSTSAPRRHSPAPGLLIKPQPKFDVLDRPISVCTRFATWLESQNYVDGDILLRAIQREGSHFLSLAKATVTFDNALRGHVPPTANGVTNPLAEHARTLRVFAELLKTKLVEGSLSRELESAVLRDGEPLLRLALSCLEFERAIRGSGSDNTASS